MTEDESGAVLIAFMVCGFGGFLFGLLVAWIS